MAVRPESDSWRIGGVKVFSKNLMTSSIVAPCLANLNQAKFNLWRADFTDYSLKLVNLKF